MEGPTLRGIAYGGASCSGHSVRYESEAGATHSPPLRGPQSLGHLLCAGCWKRGRKPASVLGVAKREVQSRDAGVPAARYPATPRVLDRTWESSSVRVRDSCPRMRAVESGERTSRAEESGLCKGSMCYDSEAGVWLTNPWCGERQPSHLCLIQLLSTLRNFELSTRTITYRCLNIHPS